MTPFFGTYDVLYVNQLTGSDSKLNGKSPVADGFGNGPVKSIHQALYFIAQLRQSGNMMPVTVRIVGDYYTDTEIDLSTYCTHSFFNDSISDNCCSNNIVIESADAALGKKARILGGRKITDWERGSFNGTPCILAKLPQNADGSYPTLNELFINGKRAQKTRFPKEGLLHAKATETDREHPETHLLHAKWVEVYPEELKGIDVLNSTVSFYHYWIDEHTPIESYDEKSGRMVFKYPSRFTVTTQYNPEKTHAFRYYLQNVASTFGDKQHFFYDKNSGTVYYCPEDDSIDLEKIEAFYPTAKHLLRVVGSEGTPIQNITVRNLEFFLSDSEYASRGCTEIEENALLCASDAQSTCNGDGAVELRYARNCSFENCEIHGVGIHALKIDLGSVGIRIESNRIYDTGAGGISVVGGSAEAGGAPTHHNIIQGNTITDCGNCIAASCGVLVRHSSENLICDNDISHCCYSGISVGWVWGFAPSTTYANIIRRNHVHHIGDGILSDLAGIYLLGKQEGTVIEYNRVHDVRCAHYGGWGIYLDEGSSYVRVENNVVFSTQNESLYIHYGMFNTCKNNILALGDHLVSPTLRLGATFSLMLENNIFYTNGTPVYNLSGHSIGNGAFSHFHSGNNLVCNANGEAAVMANICETERSLSELQSIWRIDCGSVEADPLFVNVKKRDFRLKDNSPAVTVGFVPIKGFPATEKKD